MKSIVIAGSLAQKPGRGGHSWVLLQYLLGFRKLGWDVVFLDRLEPEMCVDETGSPAPVNDSLNLRYFLEVMRRFGFERRFGLLCGGARTIGLSPSVIPAGVARSAGAAPILGVRARPSVLSPASQP